MDGYGYDMVDGFAAVGNQIYIFEFLGCYFHGCKCQGSERNLDSYINWELKKSRLEKIGNLVYVWECDFYRLNEIDETYSQTKTEFPNILHPVQSCTELLDQIVNDEFFGYVYCALW